MLPHANPIAPFGETPLRSSREAVETLEKPRRPVRFWPPDSDTLEWRGPEDVSFLVGSTAEHVRTNRELHTQDT